MSVNSLTSGLAPYPMEELARIRSELLRAGKKVYDFGTGDPKIPTWEPIRNALMEAVPTISQYPSVRGTQELREAQQGYLKRRFGLSPDANLETAPSAGSKEAIFHIALTLIGRNGKKRLIYPDPGYPVYKASAVFAGGIPTPVRLSKDNGYLLEPWTLPRDVQESAAAIWVNYPHNPTGAEAPLAYWKRLIEWAHHTDTVILADDCYVDIYDTALDTPGREADRPICPLSLSTDRVVSFMSLSKRSGMTGYRAGFMAGDARILGPVLRARANFGVGMAEFVQHAAAIAWNDDAHVVERRKIFTHRLNLASPVLQSIGMLEAKPAATFYLWCRVPARFGDDDVDFCLKLAQEGVITSPSQWLSEGMRGFVRFALVPDDAATNEAFAIVRRFVED